MSYTLSVRAATKADAKAQVAAEFEKVLAYQQVHARGKEQALAAAGALIDLLDDEDQDVIVNMSGRLGWPYRENADWAAVPLTSANFNVSAYLVPHDFKA